MNSSEFIKRLKDVADNFNTVYANGMFGQPITKYNVESKAKQLPIWYYKNNNKQKLLALADKNYYGFDCVCLIKAILWGWYGDSRKAHGGAVYCSNGVPDISEDRMIKECKDVSTDFSNIIPGEVVYVPGHIGVYIGNGQVIECTTRWDSCVQYTALENTGHTGYKSRRWDKHGKLPYINYITKVVKDEPKPKKTNTEIAKEVIQGKWGNGSIRKIKLTQAGYNPDIIQKYVNNMLAPKKKSTLEIAREVLDGKWGNGKTRKEKLTKAGYNYNTIQKKVNELVKEALK